MSTDAQVLATVADFDQTLVAEVRRDADRLAALAPEVCALLARIRGYGRRLDDAVFAAYGDDLLTDPFGERAAELIGLDELYALADRLSDAHPEAPTRTR